MSTIQTGTQLAGLDNRAKHWLFVEGNQNDAFDSNVLRALLDKNDLTAVNVGVLGACEDIRQAAKAMVYQHPSYYFLIDRDGRSDEFVARSWDSFPDTSTYNLLIWRKRELENYFLDPNYLIQSQFLVKSADELQSKLLKQAGFRLYLDAANLVLLEIRDGLMSPAEATFRKPEDFKDRSEALQKLRSCQGLTDKAARTAALIQPSDLERRFDAWLSRMTGGYSTLEHGRGEWLDLMSGKELFHSIANEAFQVKGSEGILLSGRKKHSAIARKLLSMDLEKQPGDFQKLIGLLKQRVR